MKRMTMVFSTLVALHVGIAAFASQPQPNASTQYSHGGVVWFDLMVTDSSRAEKFYGSLFGWQFTPQSANYYVVEVGGVPVGGINVMPRTSGGAGIDIYFEVDDIKVKLGQAQNQGAQVIMEPWNLPSGKGSMALFCDLDGNPIGLYSKNPV